MGYLCDTDGWRVERMSGTIQSPGNTRWALIGASDIAATRVIPAIRAHGGHISVVQSADPDWATAYADRHGIDAWTSSVSDAVARDDVDAVYVSSQNAKHRDQVIAAAEAGKHVLAEKPLALILEDARAMVDACEAADVVMATNHHLPASPVHIAMKEIVASGEIGQVRAVHVSTRSDCPSVSAVGGSMIRSPAEWCSTCSSTIWRRSPRSSVGRLGPSWPRRAKEQMYPRHRTR